MGNITAREKALKQEKIAAGRFVYVAVSRDNGYGISIAVEGISGHFPLDYRSVETMAKADLWADELNRRRRDAGSLTAEDEVEILASSLRENPVI